MKDYSAEEVLEEASDHLAVAHYTLMDEIDMARTLEYIQAEANVAIACAVVAAVRHYMEADNGA